MESVVKPSMSSGREHETKVLQLRVPIPQLFTESLLMVRRHRPNTTERMPGTHIKKRRDDKWDVKS